MKLELYKNEDRGHANFGWLNSKHTFSFGSYHNPARMGFGKLLVLNDDFVSGGEGFGTHPHKNMEIISIPLKGELKHQDSEGNSFVIKENDVQIMSAGTGIYHSEHNNSKTDQVNFLQIWVQPKKMEIAPRYEQQSFGGQVKQNKWARVVSPMGTEEPGIKINQDARFSLGNFEKGSAIEISPTSNENGLFLKVLEGKVLAGDLLLNKRDAVGVKTFEAGKNLKIKVQENSELLLIEVPIAV